RPGYALDDHNGRGLVADDGVLVALDSRDDVLHFFIGRPAEFELQHVILDVHVVLDHELHLAPTDPVLAAKFNGSFDRSTWGVVPGVAQFKIVKHGRDRRPPVVNGIDTRCVAYKGVNADVDWHSLSRLSRREVDPTKVWGLPYLQEPPPRSQRRPTFLGHARERLPRRHYVGLVHARTLIKKIGLVLTEFARILPYCAVRLLDSPLKFLKYSVQISPFFLFSEVDDFCGHILLTFAIHSLFVIQYQPDI